ncbi:ISAs1 family transposase [Brunnivagina elsteri]|uniref:ISAs1 family transposase n=1 Tax=Brunnivagina elsteri TaxID=1247191 RepID=UPI001FE344BB|nr:ISAs1 family transposase [Calothrix elsteri]
MVFERINPKEFEQCFRVWVQSLVEKLGVEVVAIDGKTHRSSYDRESKLKALHTVSAWSKEHRLVLGQTKGEQRDLVKSGKKIAIAKN